MQVSDAAQLVTSATIGNVVAHEMGISDDPAFYQILSANLYSNQKLAMVRETICNAWDAHIEAGKTDVPVRISIDENYMLTIADSGMGIPDDKIVPIYGIYGASTKKNDSKTTGGFGLGCKSPLAYTDSFQVISEHEGTRTVYNITKSSTETNGRPGIIKVLSLPTDDSGIAVKIQLNQHDLPEIVRYIKSVVHNGEIFASLHITTRAISEDIPRLPVLGMSFNPGSYDANGNWHHTHMGNHDVYVRYGNVIYPALDTPATEKALDVVAKFLRFINCDSIVIQAAPNTLALSPSRETLSSQKLTEDGIVTLCTDLVERMEIDILARLPLAMENVKEILREKAGPNLFSTYGYTSWISLVDDRQIRGYLNSNLGRKYFVHYDGQMRKLERELQIELVNLPDQMVHSLRSKLTFAKKTRSNGKLNKVYTDYVVKPLSRVIAQSNGVLSYGKGAWRVITNRGSYIRPLNSNLVTIIDSIGVLNLAVTKRVFVTSIKDCDYSIQCYMNHFNVPYPDKCASLIYKVGRKKGEAEAAVTYLTQHGYQVVDLTQVHDWDEPAIDRRNAAEERKHTRAVLKPVKGTSRPKFTTHSLYSLRAIVNMSRDFPVCIRDIQYENPDITYVEPKEPLFYVHIGADTAHNISCTKDPRIGRYTLLSMLSEEELDRGVVVHNGHQLNKAKKLGVMEADTYFRAKLAKLMTSKEMITYLTKERQVWLPELDVTSKHLRIAEILGIKLPFMKHLRFDRRLEKIWGIMRQAPLVSHVWDDEPLWKQSCELMSVKPVFADKATSLVRLFTMSSGMQVLRCLRARDLLKDLREFPECRNAYRAIVLNALKRIEAKNREK